MIANLWSHIAIIVGLSVTSMPSAFCADSAARYEWTVSCQIERPSRLLVYKNCSLKNPIKVRVSYLKNESGAKTKYEDFWYFDGKPYALERYTKMSIPAGETVAVQLNFPKADPAAEETSAGTNAALRVILDCILNGQTTPPIFVPSDALGNSIQSLQNQNFAVADPSQPLGPNLLIYVGSEDGARANMQLK